MTFKRLVLGCLFTLVLLVVGGGGLVYYLVMHTSMPLAAVQGMFDQNQEMRVKGLGGTLASGFSIESIEFPGEGGQTSAIEDVRFNYSGPWDLFFNKRLVIEEFSVGKAHLYISTKPTSTSQSTARHGSSEDKPARLDDTGLKLFRIDRIVLKNLLLEDPVADFRLEIPEASWCGLRIEGDEAEMGTVHVQSDRLDFRSVGNLATEQNGWKITLPESFEGTLKPMMHKAIRSPIDFTCQLSLTAEGKVGYHLTALQKAICVDVDADGSAKIHAAGLDLDAVLDLAPYGVPKDFNISAELKRTPGSEGKAESGRFEIHSGAFTLGTVPFKIEPMVLEAAGDEKPEIAVRSVGRSGDTVIILDTMPEMEGWRIVQRLSADPALPPRDVVAKVFFGKPYGDLSAGDQASVDAKVPIYTTAAERETQ